eukprot:gnl/TRDRNA2_/TRDRNA2_184606_c0_seq1.p1 gnl/TRDRNA2_/TRDRNA2_184606_c0~~gnl/TRDRNA2_/TRDRNA2_184606_c0_seq1.p1  ORF type:complete len:207 (+),score=46.86 gnl/TRDRNA2_/TRDRNA2_184606_c0_seq1:71-691(+)
MGVKNARNKQARKDLKKTLKAAEECPHCRKQVFDLEQHYRVAHAFTCPRCGQRYSTEVQYKQHMRDKHGVDEKSAVKEDKKKKVERWLEKSKSSSLPTSSSAGMDAEEVVEEQMEGVNGCPAAPSVFLQVCELCGAEASLPVDLAAQGLTFRCSHVGRQCAPPKVAAAPKTNWAAFGFAPAPVASAVPLTSVAINTAVPDDDDDDL